MAMVCSAPHDTEITWTLEESGGKGERKGVCVCVCVGGGGGGGERDVKGEEEGEWRRAEGSW